MARVRVRTGGRLHFGFGNLSLAHERLYGGIGAALASPRAVVEARPAGDLDAPPVVAGAARRTVDRLGVPGAAVRVVESLPRHVGLGSGTQHALATYAAIALAHGRDPDPRAAAPDLGRGGRSGIGVGAFERGGFLVDAGHPTSRFTTERPPAGEWTVPPVVARQSLPSNWRALVVRPDADRGRSGDEEDTSMRAVVESADPAVADRIAGVITRRLLPAAATGDRSAFGEAVAEISRLNGTWYADEQGGVFRPPVGRIVERLADASVLDGAGQSSWGPTAFGITGAEHEDRALAVGREALAGAGVDGSVSLVEFSDRGYGVERVDAG